MNPIHPSTPPEANSQTLFLSDTDVMTDSFRSLLCLYAEWGIDSAVSDIAADQKNYTLAVSPAQAKPARESSFLAPQHKSQTARPEKINPLSEHAVLPGENASAARHLAQQATSTAELRSIMEQFNHFSLYKTAVHTLFPAGPRHAPLMIIGDAPDAEEDRSGHVFSGLCGELLDQMLSSAGLNKDTLLLATALPWRPPGDRAPSEIELKTCRPFLEHIIRLFAPQRLLLCGRMPARILTGSARPLSPRTWHTLELEGLEESLPMMSIRHPLQLRTSPTARKDIWETILLVVQTLQQKS